MGTEFWAELRGKDYHPATGWSFMALSIPSAELKDAIEVNETRRRWSGDDFSFKGGQLRFLGDVPSPIPDLAVLVVVRKRLTTLDSAIVAALLGFVSTIAGVVVTYLNGHVALANAQHIPCPPGLTASGGSQDGRYKIIGATVFDTKTNLTWQRFPPSSPNDWGGAKKYCDALSDTLDGTGWRLPSIGELSGLADHSRNGAVIDPTAFPDTKMECYWSSSQSPQLDHARCYNFNGGVSFDYLHSGLVNVRCVR
jgi:hypothetical protein